MSWQPEVDELRHRERLAKKMGGEEKIARQHNAGKLTARERIDELLDPGSFHETGAISGKATYEEDELVDFVPDNFVMGTGRIDGRKVVVAADDFTVRGGATDGGFLDKQIYSELMAREMKLPIIRLVDGTYGSIRVILEEGATYVPVMPAWDHVVDNLGKIPVIAVCMGSVAGLGAARMVASHFSIMVEGTSQLFAAGPPVVKYGTGVEVTKEELGGVEVHRTSGAIDNIATSELDAFQQIRDFLSYLPTNVWELPSVTNSLDDPNRRDERLISAIPRDRRRVYKIRDILNMIFDKDSIFEIGKFVGSSQLTAFARLSGHPVGVIAPDVYKNGGAMSVESAEKIERFVDLCQTFHIPIVNMVDNPGVEIGIVPEKRGTLRKGVRAISAIYQATVPMIEIIMRRVFGVGGSGMSNGQSLNLRYAWPSGYWGSLPIEGGLEAAYKADLENSDNPEALRQGLLRKLEKVISPFRTAERFGIEEIIDPCDTRPLLCEWVKDAYRLLPQQLGVSKHMMRP
jgi:acetyl-CoA carboxylase carboxyltransferase component